jgi:hypothetical protein
MRARTVILILTLTLLIIGAEATSVAIFTSSKAGYADQPYVNWRENLSNDYVVMEKLQEELDTSNYGRDYEEGVFDCVSTSVICEQWLEKKGYDSYILLSDINHHAWIVVRFDDGSAVPVETTYNMRNTMGTIDYDPKYLAGFMYETAAELIVATM